MMSTMKKTFISVSIAAACSFSAQAFNFGDFAKQMEQQMGGSAQQQDSGANSGGFGGLFGGMGTPAQSSGTASSQDPMEFACRSVYGPPMKLADLGKSNEEVVGEYFNLTANLDEVLIIDATKNYEGSFTGLSEKLFESFEENEPRKIGMEYLRKPGIETLAQVIHQSKTADSYEEDAGFGSVKPSTRSNMRAVLGLILLQYRDSGVLKNPNAGVELLQKESKKVKIAGTMIGRAHLYGDLLQKNYDAAGNYLLQSGGNAAYTKLNDQTLASIANESFPGFPESVKNQIVSLSQQSASIQAELAKQKNAKSGSDLVQRANVLIEEGQKIDDLTLDALGAGSKIADRRAKANFAKNEMSGANDLLDFNYQQSKESQKIIEETLSSNVTMDDEAKNKFAEANKLRAENLGKLNALKAEVAISFFTDGLGETLNAGPVINRYFRDTCQMSKRMKDYAEEQAIPKKEISQASMDEMMMDD